MNKYKTLNDGEATVLLYRQALKMKGAIMNFSCCDCGLVHQIVILPLKTRAKVYFYRDKRATANRRRRKEGHIKK